MKKTLTVIILIIALALSLFACDAVENLNMAAKDDGIREDATSDMPSGGGGSGSDMGYSGKSGIRYDSAVDGIRESAYDIATGKTTADGDVATTDEGDVTNGEEPEIPTPRAGLLTACAYDDHEFAAYWQGLLTSNQDGDGVFAEYFAKYDFNPFYQITVTIADVAGAKVSLMHGDTLLGKAVTNNAGVAYLFAPSRMSDLEVVVDAPNFDTVVKKPVENNAVSFTKEEVGKETTVFDRIQLMFVIDTTGSMSDEIYYLKEEIDDVIGRIKQQTNAEVLLSILVYRDYGDEYLTDYSDFTSNVSAQQAYLKKQDADGGGDFPEAVEVAMAEAVDKQWSANATKIIIHVADAPAHDQNGYGFDANEPDRSQDVNKWCKAAEKAAEKGIRIISVASSGIDKMTEYCFRSQSLLTGGVYIWLTDDSGIGGAHLEGTVEKRPEVEPLNDCIVRVVAALHSGEKEITKFPAEQPAEGEEPQEQQAEQGQQQPDPAE